MSKEISCNRKEIVNNYYEEQWEHYTEKDVIDRVENLGDVIDSILSRLTFKSDLRILDIGSGPSIIPIRIAKSFNHDYIIHSYGLEVFEAAIQLGNRVCAKLNLSDSIALISGDAENIPFRSHSFDAVISNATFNLLSDKKKGFEEMERVTKDKGKIIIADCIAKEGERCRGNSSEDARLWSVCVSGAPTYIEMKKYAEQAGLDVLETEDLTDLVSDLVTKKLWDWPEFMKYDLEYHVFEMEKS